MKKRCCMDMFAVLPWPVSTLPDLLSKQLQEQKGGQDWFLHAREGSGESVDGFAWGQFCSPALPSHARLSKNRYNSLSWLCGITRPAAVLIANPWPRECIISSLELQYLITRTGAIPCAPSASYGHRSTTRGLLFSSCSTWTSSPLLPGAWWTGASEPK